MSRSHHWKPINYDEPTALGRLNATTLPTSTALQGAFDALTLTNVQLVWRVTSHFGMGLCAAGLCGLVLGAELGGGNTAPDVRMARRRVRGQTRVLPASAVGVALHPVWTAFGLAAAPLLPSSAPPAASSRDSPLRFATGWNNIFNSISYIHVKHIITSKEFGEAQALRRSPDAGTWRLFHSPPVGRRGRERRMRCPRRPGAERADSDGWGVRMRAAKPRTDEPVADCTPRGRGGPQMARAAAFRRGPCPRARRAGAGATGADASK